MVEQNHIVAGRIGIPKNMHLIERTNSIIFEYSWFKIKYIISLVAAPVFAYFLIISDYIVGDFNQFTIPVLILMLVACFVIYYSLTKLLNTTKIHVSHHSLAVTHGPLPFSRNLSLKKEQLTQLYVTQHRVGHRYYLYSATYQINAILDNKDVITLVRGLHFPEQGRFIENKIEDFPNRIKDIRNYYY